MADYTISTVFTAVTAPLQAGVARAGASLKSYDTMAMGATRQSQNFGKAVKGAAGEATMFGRPLMKLAGPAGLLLGVGAGLSASAKSAIAWESAFADVRKTVNGSEQELAALGDGLRDLSLVMPTTAQELAGVAAAAGQLGISTSGILEFTETMAMLGETTNLSADQAATTLARFMNVMGTSEGEVSNLGSTIVDLGNNFATTEQEIADMAQRIAGAGSVAGLTEGDVLGLATALSSVGIEAEAGGTAISRVMVDITNEVASGGDKLAKFAEVAGVAPQAFAAAWEEDASGALVSFVEGLDDLNQSGGNVFATLEELELSDIRVRDALLRSAQASDVFTDAMETGNRAYGENVALSEEAAVRFETTASKIDMMSNAFEELKTTAGEFAIPAVRSVVDEITESLEEINGFTDGINHFRDAMADPEPDLHNEADRLRARIALAREWGATNEELAYSLERLAEIEAELAEIEGGRQLTVQERVRASAEITIARYEEAGAAYAAAEAEREAAGAMAEAGETAEEAAEKIGELLG